MYQTQRAEDGFLIEELELVRMRSGYLLPVDAYCVLAVENQPVLRLLILYHVPEHRLRLARARLTPIRTTILSRVCPANSWLRGSCCLQ